jgi:prepilin-type N-terminal cleavage/methylation domain-containing protein
MIPICPPQTDGRPRLPSGFTLIEMLVVLAVMSILAVAASFYMGQRPAGIVRADQMAKLVDALNRTAADARVTGRAQAIDPGSIIAGATIVPVAPTAEPVSRVLRFYADGSSNGGVIYVQTRPLLSVNWLTGEVRRASS